MRFLLAIALLAAPLLAGDWDTATMLTLDKWKDCKPGSMVHMRITMEVGGQKSVHERRETLKQITRTHYVVIVETAVNGETQKVEQKEPRPIIEIELHSRGKGLYKFPDGTTMSCVVKEVTRKSGRSSGKVKLWEHTEHGVLAMEHLQGKALLRTKVVKLDIKHAVNGATVNCRALETTGAGGMTGRHLVSIDVPNYVVYREFRSARGLQRTELLAFVRK